MDYQKPLNKKIIIFLGAGFDINFGFNNFESFLKDYLYFLKYKIIKKNKNQFVKSIKFINSSNNLSIFKKFDYIESLIFAKDNDKETFLHISDIEKTTTDIQSFFYNYFDHNQSNFKRDNLEKFIDIVNKNLHFDIVTTNFSNTLSLNKKITPTNDVDSFCNRKSNNMFLAIHGNIDICLKELIYTESKMNSQDYIVNIKIIMDKIINKEFNEIIFFGYSFNDLIIWSAIIKNINERKNDVKITVFLFNENEGNETNLPLLKNFYQNRFNKIIHFLTSNKSEELFNKFIEYIESHLTKSPWNTDKFVYMNEINFIKDEKELSLVLLKERFRNFNINEIDVSIYNDFMRYIIDHKELSHGAPRCIFFLFYMMKLNAFLVKNEKDLNTFWIEILSALKNKSLEVKDFHGFFVWNMMNEFPLNISKLSSLLRDNPSIIWCYFSNLSKDNYKLLFKAEWFILYFLENFILLESNFFFTPDFFTQSFSIYESIYNNIDFTNINFTKLDELFSIEVLKNLKKDVFWKIICSKHESQIKDFIYKYDNDQHYDDLSPMLVLKNIRVMCVVYFKKNLDKDFENKINKFTVEEKINSSYTPWYLDEKANILKAINKDSIRINAEIKSQLLINSNEMPKAFWEKYRLTIPQITIEEYDLDKEYRVEMNLLQKKLNVEGISIKIIIKDKMFYNHFVNKWLTINWENLKKDDVAKEIKKHINSSADEDYQHLHNIDKVINYWANENERELFAYFVKFPALILGVGQYSLLNKNLIKIIEEKNNKQVIFKEINKRISIDTSLYHKKYVSHSCFINEYFGRAINLLVDCTKDANRSAKQTLEILRKININNDAIKSYIKGFMFGLNPYSLEKYSHSENNYSFFEGLFSNVKNNYKIFKKININFIDRLFESLCVRLNNDYEFHKKVSLLFCDLLECDLMSDKIIHYLIMKIEKIKFDLQIFFNMIFEWYKKDLIENNFFKIAQNNDFFYNNLKIYILKNINWSQKVISIKNTEFVWKIILDKNNLIDSDNISNILKFGLNKSVSYKDIKEIFLRFKNNTNKSTLICYEYGESIIEKSLNFIKENDIKDLCEVIKYLESIEVHVNNLHVYKDFCT